MVLGFEIGCDLLGVVKDDGGDDLCDSWRMNKLIIFCATLLWASTSAASWNPPEFGCDVDGYVGYDGQDTCDPSAKPGVVAFRNAILAAHPSTQDWGIVRECNIGGNSEHKEGRAWDWGVFNPDNPAVDDVLDKLLATDACGNEHALARRVGLMYIIWDHQIWRSYQPWKGWETLDMANPHTDHVHFSFSWAGALGNTSFIGGTCEAGCSGSVINYADCTNGDCGAFGAICVMEPSGPTCASSGCEPKCVGSVMHLSDCTTGDCGAFGANCVMKAGEPKCEVSCTAHCEGNVIVYGDCSSGDCGAFGAECVMQGGVPTCQTPCTPKCEGTKIISADCSEGDCGAFGTVCIMNGGQPECQTGCSPHCAGDLIVAADCSTSDCGAFGATCAMLDGTPECKTPCTPHCEGSKMIDAACESGDCGAFGATCEMVNGAPECVTGCEPHCEGTKIINADCSEGECGAFGLTCVNLSGGPECGAAACASTCQGTEILYSDCTTGDCGAFGLTCAVHDEGPECVEASCTPACNGSNIVYADCTSGDCGVFGAMCSTLGGAPHCVSSFCVATANQTPIAHDICMGPERFHCDGNGALLEKPCPPGQSCNACVGCGPVPAEACDGLDNDCDGETDEGVKNACGTCGPTPSETCNFIDDDCDGATDEGVTNACGLCGPVPVEVCDLLDNDCDGQVDEGVKNACGTCGEVPQEICNYLDDDCDGQVDEDSPGLGDPCTIGDGACLSTGAVACTGEGNATACAAEAVAPMDEVCNSIDDDCDGLTDEDFLDLGEECAVGEDVCASAGEWVCDPTGTVMCAVATPPCHDEDPCTVDFCTPETGCAHAPHPSCCAGGQPCPEGQHCGDSGLCEVTQCAPCESAADCGGAGNAVCVAGPGESRCMVLCDPTQGCSVAGFQCLTLGDDAQSVCVPLELSACECGPPGQPVCAMGAVVTLDGCGGVVDVLAICGEGACVDGWCEDAPDPGDDDTGGAIGEENTGSAGPDIAQDASGGGIPPIVDNSGGCSQAAHDAPLSAGLVFALLLLLKWRRRHTQARP